METEKQVCVVIVASHGGVNFAFSLRKEGWEARIILVDADPELPYHRPPLSKAFLTKPEGIENYLLKPKASYEKQGIELVLGQKVAKIDKANNNILLENGESLKYDKLVLSTGARPFIPAIEGLILSNNTFALRTAEDVNKIRAAVSEKQGSKVIIIGGGYIGLEIAASLKKLGCDVNILEREERVLARVTSSEMSSYFNQLHEENGVIIHTNKNVTSITKEKSHNTVVCADGSTFTADIIIVGVGIKVNKELAEDIGLKIENGISVNEFVQTSEKDIYAIGDCTFHFNPHYGRYVRLESVQNAVEQGKTAAAAICGRKVPFNIIPWFWSDQFDVKLQMVGLSEGYTEVLIREEEPHKRSAWYFKDDELLSVDAVNNAKAYVLGTKLIKEGLKVNKANLMNLSEPLNLQTLTTR